VNNIDQFFSKDPVSFAEAYFSYLSQVMASINREEIKMFIETLLDARERGVMVFFIGNGGSAATATHFANDFGYEHIFAQQVRVLGKKGDVLVAISASGNSPNLLTAFEAAKGMGIRTVALTAFDGGKLKQVADQGIHVPTAPKEYGPAEDAHMILDHLVHAYLCRLIHP
jgi:D-sedoheptulose 7-phosphate isomerase